MAHRRRWLAVIAAPVALMVFAGGCSWKRLDDADMAVASGEMRAVPTVTTAPLVDEADAGFGGTSDMSGGAPVPAGSGPPPEEVVGDLPPDPNNPEPMPALPEQPSIDACTRLSDVAAADAVAATVGTGVASELLTADVCRLTAGSVAVEVHYIAEEVAFADWFGREGVDTVGEVGPDAVGFSMWTPPGSTAKAGFTIVMVSRRQGAVVAVTGSTDDRSLAVQVALAVAATT